jgi:hypothetical protein
MRVWHLKSEKNLTNAVSDEAVPIMLGKIVRRVGEGGLSILKIGSLGGRTSCSKLEK